MFIFLLLNELNKCTEAQVEKKGAKAIPLKDTPATGDGRGGKAISNNESLKVVIKTRYQCLNSRWYMVMHKNLFDEIVVHLSKSILQAHESNDY